MATPARSDFVWKSAGSSDSDLFYRPLKLIVARLHSAPNWVGPDRFTLSVICSGLSGKTRWESQQVRRKSDAKLLGITLAIAFLAKREDNLVRWSVYRRNGEIVGCFSSLQGAKDRALAFPRSTIVQEFFKP